MREIIKRGVFALALVVAISMIAGCGPNLIRKQIESSVARKLPDLIGPAKSYQVRAYGSTLRMMRGKLARLDITGHDVKLSNGLTVSRLFVRIDNISFNTDTKQIKSVDKTEYSASLSKKELNQYLKKRYSNIPGLQLTLGKGMIGFTTRPGLLGLKFGVRGTAELLIRNEKILALNLQKLRIAGIPAPAFARRLLDSRLDTIFDAEDLGFGATIKSVDIKPGLLTLNGDLDLMKIIKQNQKT